MYNIESILGNAGVITALIIIGCLIFAECGFLFGLFVPGGDVLLLLSGVFAASGNLPLAGVLLVVFIAATSGYEVGYYIGNRTGPKIFKQKAGVLFREEYIDRANMFFDQHGAKTILIARFIGYVRTVAPLLAGIAKMSRRKFVFYNILGSLIWTLSLVMAGYWFGSAFTKEIERYITPITIIGIVIICILAVIYAIKIKQINNK
ncbi:MAG: DedA family protein [Candidatus Saccharimonadales bacterium]